MIASTKEKIKRIALSLFAKKGYDGTSMQDIASQVGINKASLYSHYSGKEEIFFAVYEDLARDYENLNIRLLNEAKNMDTLEKIRYLFEEYILYYYRNKELQAFWNQITLFTPPELREKFYSDITSRDAVYQNKMKEIFKEGIDQGVLRGDHPGKMVMSFRSMREGLLNWMVIVPTMQEELIKDFWRDLALGLERRN